MSRTVTGGLLLLLLLQCGLLAALYWPASDPQRQAPAAALAPVEAAAIDEIRIGDEHDNEAVLQRAGEHWLLPDLDGLPADPDQVGKLLAVLTGRISGWPVAQSGAARQRFQVADYLYQRRIALTCGGAPCGEIYLGTSLGFRKVHARSAGREEIYSIEFNAFDAPGSPGAWLDPRLLQVRTPLRITADGYSSVQLRDGDWLSGRGTPVDAREVLALTSALRSLQVDGVAGADTQRDLSQAQADLVLQVAGLGGEVTLELYRLGDRHFIHSSEYPLFFRLSAYDYDRLTGIDLRLVSDPSGGD